MALLYDGSRFHQAVHLDHRYSPYRFWDWYSHLLLLQTLLFGWRNLCVVQRVQHNLFHKLDTQNTVQRSDASDYNGCG